MSSDGGASPVSTTLKVYVKRLGRLLGADSAQTGDASDDEPTEDAATNPLGCVASRLNVPADVLTELGLTPEEFVTQVVEAEGGSVKQQAFTEYTAWSESTICRTLQAMEAEGHIVRIRMGRENVVYLPERAPSTGLIMDADKPSYPESRT